MPDEAVTKEGIRCPLEGCGQFHEIALDKNSKPYATCRNWGITLWFDRGPWGEAYWKRFMPTNVVCPGCGRPANPDPGALCPDCGDPWPPCPHCWRILQGEGYCTGCGFDYDKDRFRLDAEGNPLKEEDLPGQR